jgi:acetyl-CoA acetyltransferase
MGDGGVGMRGKAAIIGSAMVVAPKGQGPRRTPLQLQAEAAHLAMRDAGIGRHQVGALFTGRAPAAFSVLQYNMRLLNELKVAPSICTEVTVHGAGALGMLQLATMAIAGGVIDYALCVCGDASELWLDQVSTNAVREADPMFEAPYAPSTPALYAQTACRYMHETGATPRQFARMSVENRKWALHHPEAAMRGKGEITVDQVLASRMIAEPLRLLDCAIWYRGGIANAMVVTRADIAEASRPDPIYIEGFGQCSTHEWLTDRLSLDGVDPDLGAPSLTRTGAMIAARDAYRMAGLRPSDISLAQTSAPFSFLAVMMLEQFGFCPQGEGGRFVEAGGVDFEGGLPFNTSGGYLSFGQSSQGLYLAIECIEQLRGRARGRQVKDPRFALVHGHGGPNACHSVVILGNQPI